jgi:hypothetical protein
MSRKPVEPPAPPSRAPVRARARVASNGDVIPAFDEVDKLPPEQRRAELMRLLWATYCDAADRHYLNKHGDEVPNPDGATVMRVNDALKELWTGEEKPARTGPIGLAMFNSSERKKTG